MFGLGTTDLSRAKHLDERNIQEIVIAFREKESRFIRLFREY